MDEKVSLGGKPVEPGERFEAVDWKSRRSLFAKRVKIYAKRVRGTNRRVKWAFLIVLLAIYYVTPWIRWDRGGVAPDQAVLIDFPSRRFYFFFIEIWPQEVYYLAGLLILAALGLFFATSIAGRLWCAYGCPQTVWTDLFMIVERRIEGDRAQRIRLDQAPWTVGKIAKRTVKHALWIVISALTGGAWVFYFADAPSLFRDIVTLEAPAVAWLTVGFLTLSTYTLAGHAREQVCTYMCPYARFQSAMIDEHSYVVTYRADRGEPRGPQRRGDSWEGRGDCVDCTLCVAVCPTGIDIRDGQQIECINCGLCADACNTVMDRFERPRGLIAHDSLINIERRARGEAPENHFLRPRTFLYAAIMIAVAGVMLYALLTRSTLDINVLHDRNPLFVALSDGSYRNGYTVKILNKEPLGRTFALSAEGLPGATLTVIGQDRREMATPHLSAPADRLATYHVHVHASADSLAGASTPFAFRVKDEVSGAEAVYNALFHGPEL